MLFSYVKTIYPNLNDYDEDGPDYIETYKRQLMSLIEKHPTWSDGTKEGVLFMVAKDLREYGPQHQRYSKLYSEAGYKYLVKNREKEGENKQTEKEILNYRDHDFFVNILNSINYDNISTLQGNLQYLLLSLLTYQPPVRTDFYCTAAFIRTKEENDKKHNFVRIDRRGKVKAYYIINNDKVSKTRVYAMNKELSKIQIEDQNLAELINDSYNKFPRKYLFEITKDKPVSQTTYLSMLKKITKVDGINNDMMRSSYINWFYQHHKSLKERDELALKMRHSTGTAMRNYFKLEDETPEEKEHTVAILQKEIFEVKTNCDNDTSNDKEYKKKRRDVVYTLNKGSKPRESTLQKYNITFNKDTNKYE